MVGKVKVKDWDGEKLHEVVTMGVFTFDNKGSVLMKMGVPSVEFLNTGVGELALRWITPVSVNCVNCEVVKTTGGFVTMGVCAATAKRTQKSRNIHERLEGDFLSFIHTWPLNFRNR